MTELETELSAIAHSELPAELSAVAVAPMTAIERVEARRVARAGHAIEMKATADVARMSRKMSDDVIGQSIVATLERGHDPKDTAGIATLAWSNARQSRTDAIRARVADEARSDHFATGRMAVREDPTDAMARVLAQYDYLNDVQREAVAAALLADGTVSRPDHDAATCANARCQQCSSVRSGTGFLVGPIVPSRNGLPIRKGEHRTATVYRHDDTGAVVPTTVERSRVRSASRGLRAPKEQTTATMVRILTEASLVRMLDNSMRIRADHYRESAEPTADRLPAAAVLADLATVTVVGRRGVRVAWLEGAATYGIRDAREWRSTVAGWLTANGISSGRFTTADLPRLADAAGMSAVDLVTATIEQGRTVPTSGLRRGYVARPTHTVAPGPVESAARWSGRPLFPAVDGPDTSTTDGLNRSGGSRGRDWMGNDIMKDFRSSAPND